MEVVVVYLDPPVPPPPPRHPDIPVPKLPVTPVCLASPTVEQQENKQALVLVKQEVSVVEDHYPPVLQDLPLPRHPDIPVPKLPVTPVCLVSPTVEQQENKQALVLVKQEVSVVESPYLLLRITVLKDQDTVILSCQAYLSADRISQAMIG